MSIHNICLSSNAIPDLINGKLLSNPILQITNLKLINNFLSDDNDSFCYRVTLSDGTTTCSSCILNSSLNQLVASGDLKENTIVQIKQVVADVLDEETKRIMFTIHELDILQTDAEKITHSTTTEKAVQLGRSSVENTSTTECSNQLEKDTIENKTPIHISEINSYNNQWSIKGVVTNKTNIHFFNNSRGQGKVFSFDFLDDTGEIRITVFNQDCERFYSIIQTGQIYDIANATVKPVNRQYNHLSSNYEIFLTQDTIINNCSTNIPVHLTRSRYNFVKLCDVKIQPKDAIIDVIGIVTVVFDPCFVKSSTDNKSYFKRTIHIMDETCSVPVNLWQEQATHFSGVTSSVLAFQGIKVHDFNTNRTLSTTPATYFKYNPIDTNRTQELINWFQNSANDSTSQAQLKIVDAHTQEDSYKTFTQVMIEYIADHKKSIYFLVKATCIYIDKKNLVYKVANMCPTDGCAKKISETKNNQYYCSKCCTNHCTFKWSYMTSIKLSDSVITLPVMFFNQQVEKLFGLSASEMVIYLLNNYVEKIDKVLSTIMNQEFTFKICAQNDRYKMISRVATKITSFFHDDNENLRNVHHKRSVNLISPSTPIKANSTINESHSNTIISTCQSLKKMKIDSNHQPNNEDEHEHELTSIVDGASDEVHYASLVPLSSSSSQDQSSLSLAENSSVEDEIFDDNKMNNNIEIISPVSDCFTTSLITSNETYVSIGTQTLSSVTVDAYTQTLNNMNDTYISTEICAISSIDENIVTDEDIVNYLAQKKHKNRQHNMKSPHQLSDDPFLH